MIFNTIMVQLDGDSAATPRLIFARDAANRFEADLIAFAVAQAHVFVPSAPAYPLMWINVGACRKGVDVIVVRPSPSWGAVNRLKMQPV